MDIDEAPVVVYPDLTLADRLFLYNLPETTNKTELLKEIKDAVLKDRTFKQFTEPLVYKPDLKA
jgi:hypothetical protein